MAMPYRSVLDDLRVQLVQDLQPNDVLDYLIADNILVPDDIEKIDSIAQRRDKVRCLLDLIKRRGERALDSFMKAMKDRNSGHRHLYEKIIERQMQRSQDTQTLLQDTGQLQQPSSLPQPVQCSEPDGCPKDSSDANVCKTDPMDTSNNAMGDDIPEECAPQPSQPSEIVTEKQLSELAFKLGGNWEAVAISLGLTTSDVYRCKAENQFSVWGQIHSALIKWRNSKYPHATIGNLVATLRKCHVNREVYEFLM